MHRPLRVLLFCLAACSPGPDRAAGSRASTDGEMTDSIAGLAGLDSAEARFLSAYNKKDVEGILANYTDDIRFVIEGQLLDGKDTVRKAWLRSLPSLSGLTFKSITRSARGDLGVELESFTQRLKEPGKAEQTDSGYALAILQRQPDGRWLYQTVALSRPPQGPATRPRKSSK